MLGDGYETLYIRSTGGHLAADLAGGHTSMAEESYASPPMMPEKVVTSSPSLRSRAT